MLVVGQTHGIGPHFPQQSHVFIVLLLRQRVAYALPILMARRAAQTVRTTVENKAFFSVKSNCTAAESSFYAIAAFQLRLNGIEVWVGDAIPQVNILQAEHTLRMAVRHSGILYFSVQRKAHILLKAFHPCFYKHLGAPQVPGEDRRHLHARTTVIPQCEMSRRDHQQVYIAVDAAVKGKIGLLRIHLPVFAVVCTHRQKILAFFQYWGNVYTEC